MIYSNEHFSVDTDAYRLEREGSHCTLEPQVFDLIVYLIENRERVVSRDELLDNLWNGRIVTDSAINARIKLARKALADNGKQQKIIKTIHRRGYQFIAEVSLKTNSRPAAEISTLYEASDKPSIVVLPIEVHTDDDRSIANGLTEVIIANLSCYRELLVIDPESAFVFRDGEDDFTEFAKRLAVEYIVKGNIRRSGKRLRIAVQLIEPATGKTLWVQRLERDLADIFDLEDEVASRIATQLVGHLDEKNRSRARYKNPENLTAFDCVVRAKPSMESLDRDENSHSRSLLNQAIDLDPDNATAYAFLALNHCAEHETDWCSMHNEVLQQALVYAQKAVLLDNFNSDAHLAMATVDLMQAKFDLSERHLEQAIECNPNAYGAFCVKSWLLALSGRASEVESCGAIALRLNPLAPDNCLMAFVLAHYTQKSYHAALEVIDRIQNPYAESEAYRAACLAQLGRSQEAQEAAAKAVEFGGDFIRSRDWLKSWPFKDSRDLDHVLDGLYKCGLLQRPATPQEKPSIAVLQFRNLSQDPEQAYFSEGMALNICSCLSRIRSLLVKPGGSYDAARLAGPELAAELGVGYLLSGAVQRDGERVRVSVELIDGDSGAIKWSEHFDRSGNAVIDIQDDIAGAITGTLWSYSGTLREAEHARLANKPTCDFNAFDHILRGIHHKDRFTREDSLQAHQCFDRAIALDPQAAEAYGWSAWEHVMDITMGWTNDRAAAMQQAYTTARSAIANDSHNEMGHWALAEVYFLDGDFERGFHEYDRAMEINPNNPDLPASRGIHEANCGRFDMGIGMIRQAIERNRYHPEWYFWSLGIACFLAGDLAEAIEAFERMSEHNTESFGFLIAGLAHQDRLTDARLHLAELRRLDPGFNLDSVAELQAHIPDDARRLLLDGLQLTLDSEQPRLKSVR